MCVSTSQLVLAPTIFVWGAGSCWGDGLWELGFGGRDSVLPCPFSEPGSISLRGAWVRLGLEHVKILRWVYFLNHHLVQAGTRAGERRGEGGEAGGGRRGEGEGEEGRGRESGEQLARRGRRASAAGRRGRPEMGPHSRV